MVSCVSPHQGPAFSPGKVSTVFVTASLVDGGVKSLQWRTGGGVWKTGSQAKKGELPVGREEGGAMKTLLEACATQRLTKGSALLGEQVPQIDAVVVSGWAQGRESVKPLALSWGRGVCSCSLHQPVFCPIPQLRAVKIGN